MARTPEHLLHQLADIQQQNCFISHADILRVAEEIDLPVSQVNAVVGFYSFFHRTARGKYNFHFSNCCSCGDRQLMDDFCERLHISQGVTRADGVVSVDETSCIGMCDHGVSALINDRPMIGITSERLETVVELIEAEQSLEQWPSEWFEISDHVRRSEILLADDFESGSALKIMANETIDNSLERIKTSGLRGRGGAGFSTAQKWSLCQESKSDVRYVICNADEGEPGTFKDRVLLTSHADVLFEGMGVCARIVGAEKGVVYLRGEYRYLLEKLERVIERRRADGLLGRSIAGIEGFDFDVEIVVGAGAYICGEESALIESLEEKCGIPRIRPPFPVTHGYLGKPTVVNNVETLVAVAEIIVHEDHWFSDLGTRQSSGTKILSVSGDCTRPGVYEYPFGVTIKEVLDQCGAEDVQAVQVGGPAGRLVDPSRFDHQIAFEDIATGGSFMIFDRSRDLLGIIYGFSRFFAHESCGFCTPCRVGSTLLRNGMEKLCHGHATAYDLDEMKRTGSLVSRRSHCGLGAAAPNPILDGMKFFPELFEQRLLHNEMEPAFDLDASLEEARQLAHRDDEEAHL